MLNIHSSGFVLILCSLCVKILVSCLLYVIYYKCLSLLMNKKSKIFPLLMCVIANEKLYHLGSGLLDGVTVA